MIFYEMHKENLVDDFLLVATGLIEFLHYRSHLVNKLINIGVDIISRRYFIQSHLDVFINIVFRGQTLNMIYNSASKVINNIIFCKHSQSFKKWFNVIFNVILGW